MSRYKRLDIGVRVESVVFSVRLPAATARAFAREAHRQDRAVGWLLRKAVERYLTEPDLNVTWGDVPVTRNAARP